MTPWWQGRMAALDVESTGTSVETDRIVTAAVVLLGAGLEPERLTLLSDVDGLEIPEAASAIHGITTQQARADGRPARDVMLAIASALAPAAAAGYPLVAMNARFDLTILDRALRRHGLDPLPFMRVVDPFVLDKALHRYRKGSRKLDALCAHYGATLDDAHDAASDAIAAARLAWCIGARGEVIRRVRGRQDAIELAALRREWAAVRDDLDLLHGFQIEKAHEQALSLREYFLSRGQVEDAASVNPAWPLIPFAEQAAAA